MLIKVPAQSPDAVPGFFVVNATTPGGIDQAFATIVQHKPVRTCTVRISSLGGAWSLWRSSRATGCRRAPLRYSRLLAGVSALLKSTSPRLNSVRFGLKFEMAAIDL